ncbi:ATP-dependent RNA helicase HrpA [Motiliproteus sp. SC1-56]|uniref:ATP-dependent RNA helicase HrpA n=1 Tax=Motiliproteus sp. SC1-56 TaxID=2799565 RepID=UPI001A8D0DE3
MSDPFSTYSQTLEQCLIADRPALGKILAGMRRNARAGKPFDRLQARFEAKAQASQARVAERGALSAPPVYDEALPIAAKREVILQLIERHQVVVLAGETGSGKTTQIPKFCLELGRGRFGLIGHTQPRRLAARAVAGRIAEELNVALGTTVGYQVRFSDETGPQSRVKLMTDGILLAEIQHDPDLRRYDTLIIDEAHERSLNIDFLLGYLKRLLPRRPDLKLIITSATIDLERFSRHFNDAPIIEVSGRTYPVEVRYRPLEELRDGDGDQELSIQQGVLAAVRELEQLERERKQSSRGDVLVFLSGEREIRETAEVLRRAQLRDTQVLPLYARLSNAEQNLIFHPSGRGRRIVLATNVAETSLTVPGIRYVVDPGYARISRYSYRSKVQRLPVEPVSQASANQRKGRCGRVAEGVCIRLYSEEDFLSRPAFTDAEILRTNLASVILQMQEAGMGEMADFPFIDPPDSRLVRDGVRLLQELGALDEKGRLTATGRRLARLPVDPRLGRMVLEGAARACLSEILVIASVLGLQDPRERPLDKQQQADEKHRAYLDKESDFMGFLNLWNHYEEQRQSLSQGQLRKYCAKQFLSFMRMREWRDLHRQLHLACKDLNLPLNRQSADYGAIHRALLAGLLGQIGQRQEGREYLGARNRKFHIWPGSALAKGKAKWVMVAELVETSRLFGRTAARIEPQWIEPLAGTLAKRSYFEPHWEKKPAQVVAYEQLSLYGLVFVPRRRVHYGAVEPEEAQQIFVRAALVEGEFNTRAPFFAHNRALLKEVEALEEKSRRRDILIDEEQLYEFYREKLLKHGGERVVNGAGFEKWRQTLEAENPKALFVSREDLMRHDAATVTEARYPDHLTWERLRFRLHYHFAPGTEDDGVSIDVPAGALKRLPAARLQWLVPGMLRDKCIALLKGLPKQWRKNFVPIPDYVDALLERIVPGDETLTVVLGRELRKMTGVLIPEEVWEAVTLDPHYRFNIRVLDSDGRLLGQGRDLEALERRFSAEATATLEVADSPWERRDITAWDFGDLPAQVELEQAGMKVPAFPGLWVDGETLCLRLYDVPEEASAGHCLGVVRLLQMRQKTQLRELRKRMPQFEQNALLFSGAGRKEVLWQDLLDAVFLRTYIKEAADPLVNPEGGLAPGQGNASLPRTEAEFDQVYEQGRGELIPQAEALDLEVNRLLKRYQKLSKQLGGRIELAWAPVLNDVKQQLAGLIYPGFVSATPAPFLARYPLYLEAIEERLDKFKSNLNQQRFFSEQLQGFWQRYQQRLERGEARARSDVQLHRYRWMLEEYRVSLFAQKLGTLWPVSEKRLEKQWRACQTGES